ncbi:unnamed protein product [Callosobruchus maculatus]|uniref:Cilia- and flagella-associated protein 206 n=1 Tax=Callosobruchus maculatus TaxID=64391 RepID=A0A653CWC6_CALMS|nr:unnamed protein product [Callosobruchus maculatus]
MKHLTVVVEKCYVLNTTGNKVTLDVRLPDYCVGGVKELEDCKDLLMVYNQYYAFLEKILGELDELKERAAHIKKQYKETLAYLHEHVIPNIHIRTSLIFFGGYCCWKLVLCNGVLIKGDHFYGVCAYHNKFYVFSSANGLESFARDPEYYLTRVVEECRNNAVLIHILEVKPLMTLYKDEKVVRKDPVVYIPKRDAATTTDNEVVLSGFNHDYSWNPWDYRRKALQEAKLMTMATKTVQTTTTHLMDTTRIQTVDKVSTKETQSKTVNYSNTPTPLAYIYGLRGRKDSKQEVLNMTYYDFPEKCDKTIQKDNTSSEHEKERFFKNVWELLEKESLHCTQTATNFAMMMQELEDIISNAVDDDDDDNDDRMRRTTFFSL